MIKSRTTLLMNPDIYIKEQHVVTLGKMASITADCKCLNHTFHSVIVMTSIIINAFTRIRDNLII